MDEEWRNSSTCELRSLAADRSLLPDTLSGLLRLAVRDAQAVEASGGTLNIMAWLYTGSNGKCTACMAGAVMNQTLGVTTSYEEVSPSSFSDREVGKKLSLINWLRTGFMSNIERNYDLNDSARRVIEWIASRYSDSGRLARLSWDEYLNAADMLEAAGC